MSRIYTKEAGRCILKDDKVLATIHGVGHYDPVEVDEFADSVVVALNSHQVMKEALELYVEASLYLNGEMEEKIPVLKKARTLGYKALTLANGGLEGNVEDITHLINQVRHLHD